MLREGVRLVEDREARLAKANIAIERGPADAKAGRVKPGEQVLAEFKALAIGERARPYPFADGIAHEGVRRCLHKRNLIPYRIANDQVEILHTLNGVRDYLPLLAAEDHTKE